MRLILTLALSKPRKTTKVNRGFLLFIVCHPEAVGEGSLAYARIPHSWEIPRRTRDDKRHVAFLHKIWYFQSMLIRQLLLDDKPIAFFVIAACVALGASFAIVFQPLPVLIGLTALAAVFVFALKPEWAVFALIVTFPLLGVRLGIPIPSDFVALFPDSADLPISDVIGVLVFAAWIVRWVLQWDRRPVRTPLMVAFALFLLTGALSLANHPEPILGLKYLLRPIAFAYLVFFFVPVNTLWSRQSVMRALRVLFCWAALIAALSVVIAFLKILGGSFARVAPPIIGTFAPLGYNWNLLAEFLVPIVPIGIFLRSQAVTRFEQRLITLATLMILGAAALTFARSAWIALTLSSVVFIAHFRSRFASFGVTALLVFAVTVPAFTGLLVFSGSHAAESSFAARTALTGIAAQAFLDEPLIGRGVGMFEDLVSSAKYFVIEYGDPLDAHGVIQKVVAEQGMFGLLALGLLVAALLFPLARAIRETAGEEQFVARCCMAIAVGALVYQLFNTSYYAGKLWLPLGIAYALFLGFVPATYAREHRPHHPHA